MADICILHGLMPHKAQRAFAWCSALRGSSQGEGMHWFQSSQLLGALLFTTAVLWCPNHTLVLREFLLYVCCAGQCREAVNAPLCWENSWKELIFPKCVEDTARSDLVIKDLT